MVVYNIGLSASYQLLILVVLPVLPLRGFVGQLYFFLPANILSGPSCFSGDGDYWQTRGEEIFYIRRFSLAHPSAPSLTLFQLYLGQ